MSNDFGAGVSGVLDPSNTQYQLVVHQQGRPPCDIEINLLQQIAAENQRVLTLSGTPSGWLGNDVNNSAVFGTSALWSNWFKFGRQRTTAEKKAIVWAAVHGWLIPVIGTRTGTPPGSPDDADTWNLIALDPPPANSGDFRIDYVFLEVWLARVPPNPSTLNKPRADSIYKYGNVEGGANFLADDIVLLALGFETTQRVQVQYRIRVVKGLVGLATYPDGFDPNVVKAQGAAVAPITGTNAVFTNMRSELGDPGLWRAGDGTQNALGTVDGYSYAIPISAVFRRNSVAWAGHPSQNLNGSFNRNPTATDRTGIKTFSVSGSIADPVPAIALITNTGGISASASSFTIAPYTYLPLPLSPATAVLIQVGDEVMTYTSITISSGIATVNGVTRGANGTRADTHPQGSPVAGLSGRPDGLFADQIATTDILDLRHVVSPNGFDYNALLKTNVDKLLRGQLRSNWKRSGAGPQGPFVHYQDRISTSAGTGITKLDAPDGIRLAFSDAAATQKVQFILKADGGTSPRSVHDSWTLNNVRAFQQYNPGGDTNGVLPAGTAHATFSPGDTITLTVADLKTGLPGGDADQVRWVNDGVTGALVLRIDGETDPVPTSLYSVTPATPGPGDDIVITLGTNFYQNTAQRIYIEAVVQYGPGRGLSRRPDSIHSISLTDVNSDFVVHHAGVPGTDFPLKTAWAPLWSKFRNALYHDQLPVTAEAYADLGSKTVVVQPLRRVTWPQSSGIYTMDGSGANPVPVAHTHGTNGITGQQQLTDTTPGVDFTVNCQIGDALVVTNGPQPRRYTIVSAPTKNAVTLNLTPVMSTGVEYYIYHAQGLMPVRTRDMTSVKWAGSDPLEVFSGQSDTHTESMNMYITLPRHLVPGWGEFRLPVVTAQDEAQNSTFAEGINFMFLSLKGSTFSSSDKNYVPYGFSGGDTFATFSTWNPSGSIATYNTAFPGTTGRLAGIRKFVDSRGLGRKGLELPPFYGIARLFAVYEKADYFANHSAYEQDTRQRKATGNPATNLLRQNFDGPAFWIELDSDGDSTFILNADMIDLARCPNAVAFDTGHFVIEASIFGFDRDAFDTTKECRIVLTRAATDNTKMRTGGTGVSIEGGDQTGGTRYTSNIHKAITGGVSILPCPLAGSSVVVNYSRTPYQGDAFGTQTNYQDIGYTPGPMTSASAYQVVSTDLDLSALTRPNQKPLEVLASCGFSTTLGTGRISGDKSSGFDLRDVGYESQTPNPFPPSGGVAARPITKTRALTNDYGLDPDTSYLGCTERLPLGALWRDKDFRGGAISGILNYAPLVHWGDAHSKGVGGSSTRTKWLEQSEINLSAATMVTGQASEVLVQVDGNQSNYSLLNNFRTFRGGSIFSASGDRPGGEFYAILPVINSAAGHTNVLNVRAMLVRNAVTLYGSSEVSAGDELMLLVVTTAQLVVNQSMGVVQIGTNGFGEGDSSVDLYHLDGRPLLNDHVRLDIDPSFIVLSNRD